jgi:membrane associated rhomboid family serine protease
VYFFYFYPLGLDLPRRRLPLLTWALVLVMLLLFAWARYLPRLLTVSPYDLVFLPGNRAPWTAVTALFMHTSWSHIIGNAIYLLVAAPLLEDRLGRRRLLHYFVLLGACGNVVHGIFAANGWSGSAGYGVTGASGAISGLLAFLLVRFPFARVAIAYWVFTPLQGINRAGKGYLPLPAAVLGWLMLQVVHAVVAGAAGSQVSYGAHLGGFGLGLLLAFLLGYHRQARAERCLARGRRYLEQGQPYAAEGAFLEYLAHRPEDIDGRLQLARARRMSGRSGDARQEYRTVFQQLLAQGDVVGALEVFREARRGDGVAAMGPAELAQVAFLMEKQLDFRGAADTYLDLYRLFPEEERAELGLVRAIVLLRSKLADTAAARRWLEVARRELKPGVWRDFLENEFSRARKPRAAAPAGQAGWRPESAA